MTLASLFNVVVKITFNNFVYISSILGPILTTFQPQWWHYGWQQKSPHLTLKNVGQGHLQNSQLYDQFLPSFHRNCGTVAGNENVISADLENVGHGHNLQNHISAIIQLILSKLLPKWCICKWQPNYHLSWSWKCMSDTCYALRNCICMYVTKCQREQRARPIVANIICMSTKHVRMPIFSELVSSCWVLVGTADYIHRRDVKGC